MTDDFADYSELIVDEVGSELEEEEEETIKVRTRGKDIDWQDLELFDGPDEYNRSEIKKEICEIMIRKKQWRNNESRCENFVCKYFDKRGWKKCLRQYKICYLNSCMQIMIFTTVEKHCHEEDLEYCTKENYHWTSQQEAIIIRGIKNNVKNSLIMRNLRDEKATNGNGFYPTLLQLGKKSAI